MKAYKLTDSDGLTCSLTVWGDNITHTTNGSGELGRPGWLHFYDDPLLAVLLNPIHAQFPAPRLYQAKAEGKIKRDNGLKFGCTKLTTVKQIPLPVFTTGQQVTFAILCALQVSSSRIFRKWAHSWLSGKDRSRQSAWAARDAIKPCARAEWAAAEAATWAVGDNAVEWRVAEATAMAAARAAKVKKINLRKLAKQAYGQKIEQ